MQYCSLQHWTLLSPPDISMAGHRFHFGSGSSFLLELFLCSSPAVYWTPTNLVGLSFSVISSCLFILKRDGNTRPPYLSLEKPIYRTRSNTQNWRWNKRLVQNWERKQNKTKLGKEYIKGIYCHPAYLTSMQSTSCEIPGWMKHTLESRLPGRNISNLRYADEVRVKIKSLSCVRLFSTLRTIAHQAPPSMGFSRQEYWSGLPFPSAGDLPNSGIKLGSPTLWIDSLPSEPPGNPSDMQVIPL